MARPVRGSRTRAPGSGAPSTVPDFKANVVLHQALGMRFLRSVGSNKSVDELLVQALDALGAQRDEMFELVLRRLPRLPRK